jgi:hypothetical protein
MCFNRINMQIQVHQHPTYVEVSPDVFVKSDTIKKIVKTENCYTSDIHYSKNHKTCVGDKNYDNFMKFFNSRVHSAQYYP